VRGKLMLMAMLMGILTQRETERVRQKGKWMEK
jgi:hypothetical protein